VGGEKRHQEEEPRGRRRGGGHGSKSCASILTRKRSQIVEKNRGTDLGSKKARQVSK
jgi:hypothetical protein